MAEEIVKEEVTETVEDKKGDLIESARLKKVFAKCKKIKIAVPKDKLNPKDEYITASINGYTLQIKRGVTVEIPEPFYLVLKEAEYIY